MNVQFTCRLSLLRRIHFLKMCRSMYGGILKLFILVCVIIVSTYGNTTQASSEGTTTQTHDERTDQSLPQLQALVSMLGSLFNKNGTDSAGLSGVLAAVLPDLGSINPDNIGTLSQTTFNLARTVLENQRSIHGIGQKCLSDLLEIVDGISSGQLWALQILDSFGKPERGILHGDLNWVGNYQQCLDFYITFQNAHLDPINPTNFDTKYCRVNVPLDRFIPLEYQAIGSKVTIGSCIPESCSGTDITEIIVLIQSLLNVTNPLSPDVDCVEDRPLQTRNIIVICILAVIGFMVIIGTAYDVIAVQMHADGNTSEFKVNTVNNKGVYIVNKSDCGVASGIVLQSYSKGNTHGDVNMKVGPTVKTNGQLAYDNGSYADTDGKIEPKDPQATGPYGVPGQAKVDISENWQKTATVKRTLERGTMEKIVLSFSVYTNGVKLLSTNQAAGSLGAVNGIRFLSMAWVILGHTLAFESESSNNISYYAITRAMERWTFLGIVNGTFSVDSFFTLSGLLVAYLTLREIKKVGGAKKLNWFMFYFHRFWRLTPAYMLVLMVGVAIYPITAAGPLRSDLTVMGKCDTTWWTNLLYINNLVIEDPYTMCMGWSWYLANDMQFYVLSPLLLLPLFYNIFAGIASCLVFLSVTVGLSAYVNYSHEFRAQDFSPSLPARDDTEWAQYLYMPCYTRMGPYIIGAFTGYLLYKWECKCKINKMLNLLLWLLAVSIGSAAVYSVYNEWDSHIFTLSESTAYQALSRTGWGVLVSWIVFACATGNGGWINELLSWKAFVPLGRLSYCAYLIHPILMTAYIEASPQQYQFTDFTLSYLFVSHLAFSYGGAFLTSLVFEAPMMGMEKAIFKRK